MTDKNDDIEVDIEGEDDLEIEVQDDTPEPDKGKPKAAEVEPEPKGADDEDLEGYSESVKKRINKLKFDQHAERRAKEEAIRLREEALSYAEKVRRENEELRRAYSEGEGVLVNQTKARIESELTSAKVAYKQAYESGDADAVLAAQEKLLKLQVEHDRVSQYRPRGAQDVAPAPAKQPAKQAAPQVPKPDEKAMQWAEKNEWFMKDKAMTGYVMGVHEDLVAQGIDPTSDLYYSRIDAAVRRTFPDRFEDGSIEEKAPRRQAGSVVAPAVRSTKAPRKVVLTSTEVALAKRLGVPLKVFAAQKLKDSQNG